MAELQQGLKELVDDSAVLEGWEYLMPDEMSQAFWSTLAWPKRIDEQCKLVAEGNTALREEYAVAMQVGLLHCCPPTPLSLIPTSDPPPRGGDADRAGDVRQEPEKPDKVVAGFGKHQDVSRTKEVAAEVKRLQDG